MNNDKPLRFKTGEPVFDVPSNGTPPAQEKPKRKLLIKRKPKKCCGN